MLELGLRVSATPGHHFEEKLHRTDIIRVFVGEGRDSGQFEILENVLQVFSAM